MIIKSACTVLMIICVSILNANPMPRDMTLSIANTYISKYVTEGRNNLETGGLSSLNIGFSYKFIDLCLWYGNGVEEQYDEIQLSFGSSIYWNEFKAAFGLTDLSFLHNESKDKEIYLELCFDGLDLLTPFVANTYSFDSEGTFIEFGVEFSIPLRIKKVEINPFVFEGFDLGYVEEIHGANNTQYGITINYLITDNFCVGANIVRSEGLWDKDKSESHTWVGLTLRSSF